MMSINPYSILAETVPSFLIQGFVAIYVGINIFWNSYSNDPS